MSKIKRIFSPPKPKLPPPPPPPPPVPTQDTAAAADEAARKRRLSRAGRGRRSTIRAGGLLAQEEQAGRAREFLL